MKVTSRGKVMSEEKPKRKYIGQVEFGKIWNAAVSIEEVTEKTGLKAQTARVRAANYRKKHDIPMKIMPRKAGGGGGGVDWEAVREEVANAPGAPQPKEPDV
jgi:hypothetical protein